MTTEEKFAMLFPRLANSSECRGAPGNQYETFLTVFEAGYQEGMDAEAGKVKAMTLTDIILVLEDRIRDAKCNSNDEIQCDMSIRKAIAQLKKARKLRGN